MPMEIRISLRAPQEWQELSASEMMGEILETLQEQITARPEDRTLQDLYLLLRRVGLGLWLEEQTSLETPHRTHPEWVAEEIRLGLAQAEEWERQTQEHGLQAYLDEPPQVQAEEDWEETSDSEEGMPPLLEDSEEEPPRTPEEETLEETQGTPEETQETRVEDTREEEDPQEGLHHRMRRSLNLRRRTRTTDPQ